MWWRDGARGNGQEVIDHQYGERPPKKETTYPLEGVET